MSIAAFLPSFLRRLHFTNAFGLCVCRRADACLRMAACVLWDARTQVHTLAMPLTDGI